MCGASVSERGLGAQLPGDRRDLRGLLEQHRGQGRSQRLGRLGKTDARADARHTFRLNLADVELELGQLVVLLVVNWDRTGECSGVGEP